MVYIKVFVGSRLRYAASVANVCAVCVFETSLSLGSIHQRFRMILKLKLNQTCFYGLSAVGLISSAASLMNLVQVLSA